MFNFTKAETNAVLFVVIILLISGIYHLISPSKSLEPIYDYSASDSIFKRLSKEKSKFGFDSTKKNIPIEENITYQTITKKKKTNASSKSEKLLPNSININTASERELQKLPRIGPSKAQLIVEYRNTRGKLNSIDELLEVKGIGEKTLEKLKPFIFIE